MKSNEPFKANLQHNAESLNSMSVKENALVLAAKGYRMLPLCSFDHHGVSEQHATSCSRPGKVPLIFNWSRQATSDPKAISEWFGRWNNGNLGLLLGDGLIGIDVDGEYGWLRLHELLGDSLPATWQFSTAGGGMRYLFQAPKGMSLRKYTDASPDGGHEELAFLGDGRMTVVPPSRHQNGGQYLWIEGHAPGEIPLAPAPQEILLKMAASLTPDSLFSDEDAPVDGSNNRQPDFQWNAEDRRQASFVSTPDISDSSLQTLTQKCEKMAGFFEEQRQKGCAEPNWHNITSLLVCSGHTESALSFSEMSEKHNSSSERRIQQLEKDYSQGSFGATRCSSFGCSPEQIHRCQGSLRTHQDTGEIINSPAFLLRSATAKQVKTRSFKVEQKIATLKSPYAVEGYNLCILQTDKDGNGKAVPLSNFFAWISKIVSKDDGAETQHLYELEGIILNSNKPLPPVLVPAGEFLSMKWISLWGPEPNIQPGNKMQDTVRHAIQTTASEALQERTFAHLGWVKLDGRWTYLHAEGAIGATDVKVHLEQRLVNYTLPSASKNPQAAMQQSLNLLGIAPRQVTLALWSLVFLAPLCEWLRKVHLEPKFLVWFHGYTGSRKTTLAKLFLCHFGNLLERPPANFKDTANSLERRSFDTKDSLLLIDDYHPTSTPQEAKAMTQLAQQILRGYGDRVGRGRMKQDTTLRPDYPPRGMAIVTAEDLLEGGSSVARLFPVELKPSDVNLPKLTEAQGQTQCLREAMSGYLSWLAEAMNNGDYDDKLSQMFSNKRNEANLLRVHGRLIEAAVWLHLGLQMGLKYAVSVGAIDEQTSQHLLHEAWTGFLNTASEQGEQVTEVKATTRFLNIVTELMANGTIYTTAARPLTGENVPGNGTHVGWSDREYLYFLPDVLYNAVFRFLSAQGTQFPITASMLWRQLGDEGLTLTETSKENGKERRHYTVKKMVGGSRSRKLCIRAEVIRGVDEDAEVRMRPEPVLTHSELPDVFAPENGGIAP